MYKLARLREQRGKDLNQVKRIKDNSEEVLIGDNKIEER